MHGKTGPANVASPKKSASLVPALAVLLGAAILSAVAGWQIFALWGRLPRLQANRLAARAVAQAIQAARDTASAEGRQALALNQTAYQITRAWHNETVRQTLHTDLSDYVSGVTLTQLGRLQQAALLLLELEQNKTPPEQWWSALRPYLEGLDSTNFAHLQPALLDLASSAYEALGIRPGSARLLGRLYVGYDMGTFLQFLVDRLQRVELERRAAGDEIAAATCRKTSQRLLRQWTLNPGPASLRLLAADLLAASLDAPSHTPLETTVAAQLRAWRATYRDQAVQRSLDPLDLRREPALCPRERDRVLTLLGFVTWTAAGVLVIGLLALLASAAWLTTPIRQARFVPLFWRAGLPSAVFLGIGLLWAWVAPASFRLDFNRSWPVVPLVAAGIAILSLPLAFTRRMAARASVWDWLARCGAAAAANWLWLAAALLSCALVADQMCDSYEHAIHATMQDDFTAIAGSGADALLDAVRGWMP